MRLFKRKEMHRTEEQIFDTGRFQLQMLWDQLRNDMRWEKEFYCSAPVRGWDDIFTFYLDFVGRELAAHISHVAPSGLKEMGKDGVDLGLLLQLPNVENSSASAKSRREKEELSASPALVQAIRSAKMDAKKTTMSLRGVNTACLPWSARRLVSAFRDVRVQNGFDFSSEQKLPEGIFYPELNFCVITKRNHHVAAAMSVNREQELFAEVYTIHLKPLFPLLHVNFSLGWEEFPDAVSPHFAFLYWLAQFRQQYLDENESAN